MELKPAHETILAEILGCCKALQSLDVVIKEGTTRRSSGADIPPGSLAMCRSQKIGGLDSLVRTFEITIIPEEKLDEVIASLNRRSNPWQQGAG